MREALDSFQALSETPVARHSLRWHRAIEACDEFIAWAGAEEGEGEAGEGGFEELAESLRCASDEDPLDVLREFRGSADVAFALALGGGPTRKGRLLGHFSRDERGSLVARAELSDVEPDSLAALLVPGSEPPGPATLSSRDTLVHARLRPRSGLDIAARIAPGSQADKMFRLRSKLFFGQVLEGTWELAIYMPDGERTTPPMAIALDTSLPGAARLAVDEFLGELESTWPIHRTPVDFAEHPGHCFFDLRILPDLVPCFVVTDRSLVVGWNPLSVRHALARAASELPGDSDLGEEGGLVMRLDRLPEADRRLRRQLDPGTARQTESYVWDRLRMQGAANGKGLELKLELSRSGAS